MASFVILPPISAGKGGMMQRPLAQYTHPLSSNTKFNFENSFMKIFIENIRSDEIDWQSWPGASPEGFFVVCLDGGRVCVGTRPAAARRRWRRRRLSVFWALGGSLSVASSASVATSSFYRLRVRSAAVAGFSLG
jgi:hypothetical protein